MKIKLPKFTVTKATVATTIVAVIAGVPMTDAIIDAARASEWQPKSNVAKGPPFIRTVIGSGGERYTLTTRGDF